MEDVLGRDPEWHLMASHSFLLHRVKYPHFSYSIFPALKIGLREELATNIYESYYKHTGLYFQLITG